jgi:hypothetical protein
MLAARHILINAPAGPDVDSLKKKAESVRAQAAAKNTVDNFSALANKYNQQGAAGPGGELGVFPKGAMVPEFEKAVLALKPGEISPVVRTQFGYHIIRRSTYDEAKAQLGTALGQRQSAVAESTFLAKLEANKKVEVKPTAPAALKALAKAPDEHKDDKTVIGSSTDGDFTVAQAAKWINGFPQPAQLYGQIQQAPDSLLPQLVRNLERQEILMKMADSAKFKPDTAETSQIRKGFVSAVSNTWSGLRIAPRQLADSAKSSAERERLAAARVDQYLDALIKNEAQFIPIPSALQHVLRAKYDSKVNDAGIDRALEAAQKVRQSADSSRAANQPPSAVPMPGQTPQPTPPPAGKKPDSAAKKP